MEKQTALGSKDAKSQVEWDMDETSDPNNFLYLFRQASTFNTAAPFCVAVSDAIRKFETNQMDAEKPTNSLLCILSRDALWEVRHVELFYFKFLCVEVAKKGKDERDLRDFVERFIDKTETKFGSDYNDLKSDLKRLMEKKILN